MKNIHYLLILIGLLLWAPVTQYAQRDTIKRSTRTIDRRLVPQRMQPVPIAGALNPSSLLFTGTYYGKYLGKKAILSFTPKRDPESPDRYLISIILRVEDNGTQQYSGQAIYKRKETSLHFIKLERRRGSSILIEKMKVLNEGEFVVMDLVHQLNLIFAKDRSLIYEKVDRQFLNNRNSFEGTWKGTADKNEFLLYIDKKAHSYFFSLTYGRSGRERETYGRYFTELPPEWVLPNMMRSIILYNDAFTKSIELRFLELQLHDTNWLYGEIVRNGRQYDIVFEKYVRPPIIPTTITLNRFPWPPPRATSIYDLPRSAFDDMGTLGEVDDFLSATLENNGYESAAKSYYRTPNGFALVTGLEQIDCDGAPMDGADRWKIETRFKKSFKLSDIFSQLLFIPPSHYRIFVFIVTDDLTNDEGPAPSPDEADGWRNAGINALPDEIKGMPFTSGHECSVRVYQFEKVRGKVNPEVLLSATNDCWKGCDTHLMNTGLLAAFTEIRP